MLPFRLATAATLALAASSAFGADLAGKWLGHIEVDLSSLKPPLSATEMHKERPRIEAAKGIVFHMELRKGGTYTMLIKYPGRPDQHDEGKWSLDGKVFSRTVLKINGKASKPFTSKYELAKGGKKLVGLTHAAGSRINQVTTSIFVRE